MQTKYDFAGKNILIAEDEDVSRFLFENILKRTNANLFFAENGKEAVDIVEENSEIDAVIMDIRLPIMDGFEATAKIKEIIPNIPVVMQSAYVLEYTHERAKEIGCNDFLSKPINIKSLLSILNDYLTN